MSRFARGHFGRGDLGLPHLRCLPGGVPGLRRAHPHDRRHATQSGDDRIDAWAKRPSSSSRTSKTAMHPWVGTAHDREAWFADLDIKVLGRGDTAEYLFWVGCTGALVGPEHRGHARDGPSPEGGGAWTSRCWAPRSPARATRAPGRRELSFQTCAKTNIETLASATAWTRSSRPVPTASTASRTSTRTSTGTTRSSTTPS